MLVYRYMNNKYTKNLITAMLLAMFVLTNTASAKAVPLPDVIISPISITTLASGKSTTNSCVFNGQAVSGLNSPEVWFEYNKVSGSFGTVPVETSHISLAPGTNDFTMTVSNLDVNTTYSYRAMMKISSTLKGVTYTAPTSQLCLTKGSPKMTVDTNNYSSLTNTSFTANGTITLQNEIANNIKFIYGTTSSNLNQVANINGSKSINGPISATISGLNPDTDYYYKACATAVSTNIQSCGFTTVFVHTTGSSTSSLNITTDSADPSRTSAKLYGSFDGPTNSVVSTYFKWGSTTSLANQTNIVNSGTNSGQMSETITGLNSNTKYYYQACATKQVSEDCGTVKNFTTDSSSSGGGSSGYIRYQCNDGYDNDNDGYFDYPYDPGCSSYTDNSESPYNGTVTLPTPNPTPIISYVNYGNGYVNNTVTTTQFLDLSITTPTENVFANDNVEFTLSYANISRYAQLKNVTIEIVLPNELTYVNSQSGVYDMSHNSITIDLGTLSTLENGKFIFDARVDKFSNGNDMSVTASAKYTVNGESKITNAMVNLHNAEPSIDNSNLTGNALFGDGSFLPNTFFGWIVLLLILFGIIFLGRKMYKKDEPTTHNTSTHH